MALSPALARRYAEAIDPLTRAPALTEAEFAARAHALDREFAGLLDEDALGLMILDELGLNAGALVTLRECRGRAEASVRVRIDRIEGVREFSNDRGGGRVASALVSDPTGEARLTLWGRDCAKIEDRELREGATVRVLNARVKDGRFGMELHVGPWTALEVEGALAPAARKLLADVDANAEPATPPAGVEPDEEVKRDAAARDPASAAGRAGGIAHEPRRNATPAARPPLASEIAPATPTPISRIHAGLLTVSLAVTVVRVKPTRAFERRDGSTGFVANVEVADESGRILLTAWDEDAKRVAALPEGRRLVATDLAVKDRLGVLEVHVTHTSHLDLE